MAQMIAVQVKALFENSPAPTFLDQHSACVELRAHRLVSSDKASKDGPASMVIGTGLQFLFDGDNQMQIFGREEEAYNYGIRLANGVSIVDVTHGGEVLIKLVRDNHDKAAVQAWDKLVDDIGHDKFPIVARAQFSQVSKPLFMAPPEQPQEAPAPAPADELPANMPQEVRELAQKEIAKANDEKQVAE